MSFFFFPKTSTVAPLLVPASMSRSVTTYLVDGATDLMVDAKLCPTPDYRSPGFPQPSQPEGRRPARRLQKVVFEGAAGGVVCSLCDIPELIFNIHQSCQAGSAPTLPPPTV